MKYIKATIFGVALFTLPIYAHADEIIYFPSKVTCVRKLCEAAQTPHMSCYVRSVPFIVPDGNYYFIGGNMSSRVMPQFSSSYTRENKVKINLLCSIFPISSGEVRVDIGTMYPWSGSPTAASCNPPTSGYHEDNVKYCPMKFRAF